MKPTDLKQVMSIKDRYAKDRHKEQVELSILRFSQAMKLIDRRDAFAKERHRERCHIMFPLR